MASRWLMRQAVLPTTAVEASHIAGSAGDVLSRTRASVRGDPKAPSLPIRACVRLV
jgi:hypothetical protein